jgi:hypothetical protein
MAETGRSLAELAAVMDRLPQVLVNVRAERSRAQDPDVLGAVTREQEALGTSGRVLLRPSGTEPLVPRHGRGRDGRAGRRRGAATGRHRGGLDTPRPLICRCRRAGGGSASLSADKGSGGPRHGLAAALRCSE